MEDGVASASLHAPPLAGQRANAVAGSATAWCLHGLSVPSPCFPRIFQNLVSRSKNVVVYLRTRGPEAADRRADRHGVPLGSSVTGCPYRRKDNGGGAGLARAIRMSERRVLSLPVRC